MQVDRRNLEQGLEEVLADIEKGAFVAFDCEFTGLVTQLQRHEGFYPDSDDFYERIKETAFNFKLLQLGLTVFKRLQNRYIPKSYNFFLLPTTYAADYHNVVVCEVDSLAFLAHNSMDFTRTFKYGIPTCRIGQKKQPIPNFNEYPGRGYTFFGPEDLKRVAEIENILSSAGEKQVSIDFGTKTIMNHFKNKYEYLQLCKNKQNKTKYDFTVYNYDAKTQNIEFEKEGGEGEKQQEPLHVRGIEVVIQRLIKSRIPLVGHFPNLDLGLIYQTFIAELPDTFAEFSSAVRELFPAIYDTKVLSRRLQQLGNKGLKHLKVDLKSLYHACFNPNLLKPYVEIDFDFVEGYVKHGTSHEAGFDSFMTGCAFLGMASYFAAQETPPKNIFDAVGHVRYVLFSKFSQEISFFPPYSSNTAFFSARILISPFPKGDHPSSEIGKILSSYGTVQAIEDHSETYYVFEEAQNIALIREKFPEAKLKPYCGRRLIRARRMYRPLQK